ncbi:MAG: hypothetical protein ABFD00_10485 [Chloroherpetonaceae bacterium]
MSGECDKCGEHTLECGCKRKAFLIKEINEEKKSFEQLVEEKAGCFEFAWNGYIHLYKECDKRCECKDCQAIDNLKTDFDAIYTPILMDSKVQK